VAGRDVDTEIIGGKLAALTEEMCLVLQRSSRSLYVKETADFCCALAGPDGRFTAYPKAMGVSGFVGLSVREAAEAAAPLEPGDVIVTNDPYTSGGLATHLTDIQLIEPYFHEGALTGYGWAFIHCSDIGGRVPSSLSPTSTEIYAEGLQIPPVKLLRKGEWNTDVERLLAANTRTPEANLGDIMAMLAALRTGRLRLSDVIAQHGHGTVRAAQVTLLAYTAERARAALSTLAEGTYRFTDYLDDDAVSRVPVRISVTATLEKGDLHLDFTGTDPQVAAAFNIATLGRPHAWITTRVLALICTLDPRIPLNGGLLAPVSVTAPEGSVVNAVRPAAVGVRHATAQRVNDAVGGALAQAGPEILPAASSGLVVPVVVADSGSVQVLEPMTGGTGARYGADGTDGRDPGISNLSNNPVETVETEIGAEILRYALRPDSGGAGRWRGGCGLELVFRITASEARLLARGLERLCFRPWGMAGGGPGAPTELEVNGEPVAKIDMLTLRRGDVVTLRTAGAGGYGNPFERDPAAVVRDVERGLVSVTAAQQLYGIADDRSSHTERGWRTRPASTAFGPERVAWETVFDVMSSDRLVAALFRRPAATRQRDRAEAYAAVLAELPEGFPRVAATPSEIEQARKVLEREMGRLE
jgi:N-methylhydantoinase B